MSERILIEGGRNTGKTQHLVELLQEAVRDGDDPLVVLVATESRAENLQRRAFGEHKHHYWRVASPATMRLRWRARREILDVWVDDFDDVWRHLIGGDLRLVGMTDRPHWLVTRLGSYVEEVTP